MATKTRRSKKAQDATAASKELERELGVLRSAADHAACGRVLWLRGLHSKTRIGLCAYGSAAGAVVLLKTSRTNSQGRIVTHSTPERLSPLQDRIIKENLVGYATCYNSQEADLYQTIRELHGFDRACYDSGVTQFMAPAEVRDRLGRMSDLSEAQRTLLRCKTNNE